MSRLRFVRPPVFSMHGESRHAAHAGHHVMQHSDGDSASKIVKEFMAICAPRFQRPEVRRRALQYVLTLIDLEHKVTAARMARINHESNADGVQRLLASARWDEAGVRDDLRQFVLGKLPQAPPSLIVSTFAFRGPGGRAAATATAKQVTPGWVSARSRLVLFLTLGLGRQQVITDVELCAPPDRFPARTESVASGSAAWEAATSPTSVVRAMLDRQLSEARSAPWVVSGDPVIDAYELAPWLDARSCNYALALASRARISRPARRDGRSLLGEGSPRTAWRWSVSPDIRSAQAGRPRWILEGRDGGAGDTTLHWLVCAPPGTGLREMIEATSQVDAARRVISSARNSIGLGEHAARTQRAWQRQTVLTIVALAARVMAELSPS